MQRSMARIETAFGTSGARAKAFLPAVHARASNNAKVCRCDHISKASCASDNVLLGTDTSIKEAALTRRETLAAALLTAFTAQNIFAMDASADEQVLYVSPSDQGPDGQQGYGTISAALAARSGSGPCKVLVAAGTYTDRLVITQGNISVEAYPQGSSVEVSWSTQEPYQSVVDCTAQAVKIQGITFRHASKSVANNFGIYLHEGTNAQLVDCDISSSTGCGVGIEAASPVLTNCKIHDCARQGVAVFGPLDPLNDPPGEGKLQDCAVVNNASDGVLARGGAEPQLLNTTISGNKGWGVSLQESGGVYRGNTIEDNGKGAFQAEQAAGIERIDITSSNAYKGRILFN